MELEALMTMAELMAPGGLLAPAAPPVEPPPELEARVLGAVRRAAAATLPGRLADAQVMRSRTEAMTDVPFLTLCPGFWAGGLPAAFPVTFRAVPRGGAADG